MAPPFAKYLGVLRSLDKPIDGNKTFKGKPILGSHKTWRGIVAGLIAGLLAVLIQAWLYNFSFFKSISFLNYHQINIFVFGLLISFGTLFGDCLFAFFKRRIGKKPGERWLPFDQINYVIGCSVFLTPYLWNYFPDKKFFLILWILLLTLTFFLHIIFNRLGYLLKIHQAKW
jgi:CDP-2,3-bis-(O-geranylgeranyl)-sn-glycerol synthase